jgi:hypothetical protein
LPYNTPPQACGQSQSKKGKNVSPGSKPKRGTLSSELKLTSTLCTTVWRDAPLQRWRSQGRISVLPKREQSRREEQWWNSIQFWAIIKCTSNCSCCCRRRSMSAARLIRSQQEEEGEAGECRRASSLSLMLNHLSWQRQQVSNLSCLRASLKSSIILKTSLL